MDDELQGVKGWLAVFVAIMAVISPAYSIYTVYSYLYNGPFAAAEGLPIVDQLRTFEWSLVAVATLIGWFVAYRLLAVHNWTSVQIAIAGIWIVSVGGMVAEFAGISMITGFGFGDILGGVGPGAIIRPFIFGLIWTAYLLKSQRVENTYRGGEEQADVFE